MTLKSTTISTEPERGSTKELGPTWGLSLLFLRENCIVLYGSDSLNKFIFHKEEKNNGRRTYEQHTGTGTEGG